MFNRAQAGTVPYMLMADLGADVIKIEGTPTAATHRAAAACFPVYPSTYFETNNRGVKSVHAEPEDAGRAGDPAPPRRAR